MSEATKFTPILLGSDMNVYGWPGDFIVSVESSPLSLSASRLAPTYYSKN